MKHDYTEIGFSGDIKPCPFCGTPAYLNNYEAEENYHRKVVMCSNEDCPMDTPPNGFYRSTKIEAVETWNMRFYG